MEPERVIGDLEKRFPGEIVEASRDGEDPVLIIRPEALLRIMGSLKEPPYSYRLLLDLTCVDFRRNAGSFEMVYHLYSLDAGSRVRVKVRVPAESPSLDSLADLWRNANWLEREVYDMFGVVFRGHPDLKRILMYDGFEGFPLRKDYPLRRRQAKAVKGNVT